MSVSTLLCNPYHIDLKNVFMFAMHLFSYSHFANLSRYPRSLVSFPFHWVISFSISFRADLLRIHSFSFSTLRNVTSLSFLTVEQSLDRIFSLIINLELAVFFSFSSLKYCITFFWPPWFLIRNLPFLSLSLYMKYTDLL